MRHTPAPLSSARSTAPRPLAGWHRRSGEPRRRTSPSDTARPGAVRARGQEPRRSCPTSARSGSAGAPAMDRSPPPPPPNDDPVQDPLTFPARNTLRDAEPSRHAMHKVAEPHATGADRSRKRVRKARLEPMRLRPRQQSHVRVRRDVSSGTVVAVRHVDVRVAIDQQRARIHRVLRPNSDRARPICDGWHLKPCSLGHATVPRAVAHASQQPAAHRHHQLQSQVAQAEHRRTHPPHAAATHQK